MDLKDIKGIGPKVNLILKNNGISDVRSLVSFFPSSYKVNELSYVKTDEFNVKGIISSEIDVSRHNKIELVSFDCIINNKSYKVKAFNMGYIKKVFSMGEEVVVDGEYDNKYHQIILKKLYKIKDYSEGIVPIYNIDGIKSLNMSKIIKLALSYYEPIKMIIPYSYFRKYDYKISKELLMDIHFPKDKESIRKAYNSLKYFELLNFSIKMEIIKRNVEALRRDPIKYDNLKVNEFNKSIPFKLTEDQKRSVIDIFRAFGSNRPLNMLLEGDVGCGKTIVSIIASYGVITAGYQVLVFAPTEALAYQHFNTYKSFLDKFNVRIELLSSSTKAKDRENILNRLEEGSIDIIIGTHSLLSDSVKFKNLRLLVLDEQHKAGVNQRKVLREKGLNTDILYMSATPIPRSLALSYFSDLTLEEIRSVKNDSKVHIFVHEYSELDKVYDFMYKEIKSGRQGYVVCPLIDDNLELNLKGINNVKEELKSRFSDLRIETLSGRTDETLKFNILERYKNGEIDVLVSTTVIEVGIDNKNSSVMIIRDAYRFGLSQLHQLRGRVGRGDYDGYCFLLVNSNEETERVNLLETCSDGFMISEADLNLRGAGDFLGVNQSGRMDFKYADIIKDKRILDDALRDAKELVDNPSIKEYYERLLSNDNFD